MKLTCFITVCACLSSTVSTEEINLNRIKKFVRSREELTVKDATVGRQINPIPQIYPEIFPTRHFRPQTVIEKPKKNYEFQSGSLQQKQQPQKPQKPQQPQPQPQQQQQQQQQYRYNRGYSKYPMKRLKTRSIIGASTFDVNNNHLDSIPEVVPDEKPIRIEPVYRVTSKKTVLDSIVDIVRQLLDPPSNEKGPLVPVQLPGSTRKIYLRLIEPLDRSQVVVRFVTQLAVPVVDAEKQYNPYVPIPSIIAPSTMLLNHAYHGHPPVLSGDASFASSSHRHQAVYPPRNVNNQTKGSQSIKPVTEDLQNPSQSIKPVTEDMQNPSQEPDKENFPPAIALSHGVESDKTHFTDPRLNLQPQLSEPAGSYYDYQAANNEAINKVNEILKTENATMIESQGGLNNPSELWLSTHHLPLRQIAPLYPLTSMAHDSSASSNSYATDTYKPQDGFTTPSSYDQYNAAANSPSGFYPSNSYGAPSSYPASYKQNEIQDTQQHPNAYPTSYHKPNEFNGAPPSNPYSVPSYPNQNEFNGVPNPYSNPYQNGAPNSFAGNQNHDLFGAPSVYTSVYEKPTNVPPLASSYEKPTAAVASQVVGSSSRDALRIIDPPSYLSGYRTEENPANRSFEHTIAEFRPRYIPSQETAMDYSLPSSIAGDSTPLIWGKAKREKTADIAFDDNRDRWQPAIGTRPVYENVGWHEEYEAELAKAATTTERQPFRENRPTKKSSRGSADHTRRHSKHRGDAIARESRCSTALGEHQNGCEQAKSTTVSTPPPESTVRIVEKQSAVNSESIAVARSTLGDTVEASKPNVIVAKSLTTNATERSPLMITIKDLESTSGGKNLTTEQPTLLIKVIKGSTTTTTTSTSTTTTTTTTTTTRPPLLIKAIENTLANGVAERLIATEASVTRSASNKTRNQKSTTKGINEKSSGTIEKSSGTIEKSTTTNNATIRSSNKAKKELPKRPMVMKKSTYIMKKPEVSSTTRRTVTTTLKPTTSSTSNKRTTAARKSKFASANSKTKSIPI